MIIAGEHGEVTTTKVRDKWRAKFSYKTPRGDRAQTLSAVKSRVVV